MEGTTMRSMMVLAAAGSLACVLAGCGGGRAMPSMTPSGGDLSAGSAKSAPAPAGYPGAAPAPLAEAPATESAPSAPGGAARGDTWSAQQPAPEDRPGLGTEWGEARESHIREVAF